MAQITSLRPNEPRTLGPYRPAARLGEGEQGVVYAAHAPDGTPVALKVLRDEWAPDTHVRDRFAKEVAAVSTSPYFRLGRQEQGRHVRADRPRRVRVRGAALLNARALPLRRGRAPDVPVRCGDGTPRARSRPSGG
ncbi:MAG: hypothetical protein ACRDP6_42995 [Actinoallomurus sp.]